MNRWSLPARVADQEAVSVFMRLNDSNEVAPHNVILVIHAGVHFNITVFLDDGINSGRTHFRLPASLLNGTLRTSGAALASHTAKPRRICVLFASNLEVLCREVSRVATSAVYAFLAMRKNSTLPPLFWFLSF
jgi:predicted membrane-bound mannosyltransferase